MHLRWCDFGTLLHQSAESEPQAIFEVQLILQFRRFVNAGVRIHPLARTDSTDYEQFQGHEHVGGDQAQPDLIVQWRQKGHQTAFRF